MLNAIASRLGLPRSALRPVATYYLSYVALGTVSPALGPSLPYLAERAGVSLDVASGLFSAKALGFLLGSFVIGRVLTRLPSHGAVQVAMLVMAAAMLGLAWAPRFVLLLAILLVSGFFTAWLDVGSNILLTWQLREKVAPYLSGLHFIWGLGALAVPLVIVELHQRTGSLAAPFSVIAVFVTVCALSYAKLPAPHPAATTAGAQGRMRWRPMAALMVMLFLAGSLEMTVGGFIFSYLLRTELASEQVAGGVTSSFFAAVTITRLGASFLLLRFSCQAVLTAAVCLILAAAAAALLQPASLPAVWAAVLLCGIGEAALFPLALALVPQFMANVERATSLMFVGTSIGSMTVPLLIGKLFESAAVGPQVVWYYTLVGSLLYGLCLLSLHFAPRVSLATAHLRAAAA